MSTPEYEAFVYDAVNKDWEAQREFHAQMVEILDPASEVRIVSGDTTDFRMSVEGMNTINDYGEKNLPGGEVFTAPVADSVEGQVPFDKPLVRYGREIEGTYLRLEDGFDEWRDFPSTFWTPRTRNHEQYERNNIVYLAHMDII
jgi:aminopeptidase